MSHIHEPKEQAARTIKTTREILIMGLEILLDKLKNGQDAGDVSHKLHGLTGMVGHFSLDNHPQWYDVPTWWIDGIEFDGGEKPY